MSNRPKTSRRHAMTPEQTERVREAYRRGGAPEALRVIESMFPAHEVLVSVGEDFRRHYHEAEPVACPAHDRVEKVVSSICLWLAAICLSGFAALAIAAAWDLLASLFS